MGAIFAERRITIAEGLLKTSIANQIQEDYERDNYLNDFYRGSFGSSTFAGTTKLDYKGKTAKGKEKQLREFLNKETTSMKKYEAKAVIYSDNGYIGYKIGFIKNQAVNKIVGPVRINSRTLINGSFDNITELKRAIDQQSDFVLKDLYGYNVLDVNGNPVGKIGIVDRHFYKTKPKACPKKYTSVDLLVDAVIYGINPV